MARPFYETNTTLDAERKTIEAFVAKYPAQFEKLKLHYEIDWALRVGRKIVGWVECKSRYFPHNRYPTYNISLSKWIAGNQLANTTGVPFILVIEWSDGIRWVRHDKVVINRYEWWGRKDRNDPDDMEPTACIDIKCFTPL